MNAAPPGADRRALLSSASRIAVIDALRSAPGPMSVTELVRLVGLHPNTVRWHLDQLVDAGWVERAVEPADAKHRPGRPRLMYAPTSSDPGHLESPHAPDDGYRLLADVLTGYLEHESPDPAAAAAAAGRARGGELVTASEPFAHLDVAEASRRVVAMLDDLGFSPEPDVDGWISLHSCPFRELAEQHPEVACSVHLGLMQGALTELGMPATAARLKPFDSPHICLARIRDAAGAPAHDDEGTTVS